MSETINNAGAQKLVATVEEYIKKEGFLAFFILRLLYLPYMPLSYAAGLVRTAKLRDFALATFLTNIIGGFVFVYFGDQLGSGLKNLLLPASLIIISLLIPRIIRWWQARDQKDKR